MLAKRKRAVEGVLFDWDGTLIDSYQADSSAYLAMFKEMGITWGLEELEKNYSPNWYHVYRAARLPRKRWADADRLWRAHYAKHRPRLMAGARWVLARLRRTHALGLVTSGDRDRVARQLREFSLTKIFSARVCNGDTLRKKPHPEPLRFALRQMDLDPSACVYVGDAGRGNGPARWRACDWRARPLSDREASARSPPGVFDRFHRGIAGCSEEIALLMDRASFLESAIAYGFGEVAGAAGAGTGGTPGMGLKSVHLITMRTGVCTPF